MSWYKNLHNELTKSNNTIEEMQSLFYKTAKKIMNEYNLNINGLQIELTEIEFYYFNCKTHSDIYTHLHPYQKTTEDFLYVHEAWGNYGGIDITFGDGESYGGILIRGIKIEDTYTAGASKVRQELVKHIDKDISTYTELQDYFFSIKDNIGLTQNKNNHMIYNSTRFNLGKKDDDKFRYALYRFVRQDYLKADSKNFPTRKNLQERSMIKAISDLSLSEFNHDFISNEQTTKTKINTSDDLSALRENIKSFKNSLNTSPQI